MDLLRLHPVLCNFTRIYWTSVVSKALGGKVYGSFYLQKVYNLVRGIRSTWQNQPLAILFTDSLLYYNFSPQMGLGKWHLNSSLIYPNCWTNKLMLCLDLFIIKSLSLPRLSGLLTSCFLHSSSTYHSRTFLILSYRNWRWWISPSCKWHGVKFISPRSCWHILIIG